jgi:hypothetical protein
MGQPVVRFEVIVTLGLFTDPEGHPIGLLKAA